VTTPPSLSEHAQAVYDVLLATATRDDAGRLVSNQTLYRFLEERFDLQDPASRRARTAAVRELTAHGLVLRDNVRGRTVELLSVGDDTSADGVPTFDDYSAAIGAELDVVVEATRRVEQAFLRRVLLQQRSEAHCGFCGRLLPADLLVAAHLKRRAELTRGEKLHFQAIAVLACSLGCDVLYELGYLSVDDDGRMVTAAVPTSSLGDHLAGLRGRPCPGHSKARAGYFNEHRARRFRDGPKPS
jgi:hypothetical protein